jgi:hypothetical protein
VEWDKVVAKLDILQGKYGGCYASEPLVTSMIFFIWIEKK